jgi:exodeoxyribonuclease VII large subunit
LQDILTVLRRRFAAVPVIIYPAAVQGQSAKLEIAAALAAANRRRECDVLIVARGGGSLEDLWAFNEEVVVRAIYASRIPVIAAIGHETDFTIADFVADLRAPTPSAAAERAVPDGQALLRQFRQGETGLLQRLQASLARRRQQLEWLDKRLQQQHMGRRLQNNAQRLDDLEVRLSQALRIKMHRNRARIADLSARAERFHPHTQIRAFALRQQYLAQRLNAAIEQRLRHAGERLATRAQALHTVSPLATLRRGYAIVTAMEGNTPLTSTASLHIGALLKARLASGRIISRIEGLDND